MTPGRKVSRKHKCQVNIKKETEPAIDGWTTNPMANKMTAVRSVIIRSQYVLELFFFTLL